MRRIWVIAILSCITLYVSCSGPTKPASQIETVWTKTQEFTEKHSQQQFVFTPISREIGIKFTPQATVTDIEALAARHGLTAKFGLNKETAYNAFELPRGVKARVVGSRILASPDVEGVLPVYLDQAGRLRYVDPKWLVMKFELGTSEGSADSMFSAWGASIVIDHGTPGLYIISVADTTTVFDAFREYVCVPAVRLVQLVDGHLF